MLVGVQISSTLTFDFVSVIVLPRLCVSLQTQQRKEYLKNCFTELLTCMELISLSLVYRARPFLALVLRVVQAPGRV